MPPAAGPWCSARTTVLPGRIAEAIVELDGGAPARHADGYVGCLRAKAAARRAIIFSRERWEKDLAQAARMGFRSAIAVAAIPGRLGSPATGQRGCGSRRPAAPHPGPFPVAGPRTCCCSMTRPTICPPRRPMTSSGPWMPSPAPSWWSATTGHCGRGLPGAASTRKREDRAVAGEPEITGADLFESTSRLPARAPMVSRRR